MRVCARAGLAAPWRRRLMVGGGHAGDPRAQRRPRPRPSSAEDASLPDTTQPSRARLRALTVRLASGGPPCADPAPSWRAKRRSLALWRPAWTAATATVAPGRGDDLVREPSIASGPAAGAPHRPLQPSDAAEEDADHHLPTPWTRPAAPLGSAEVHRARRTRRLVPLTTAAQAQARLQHHRRRCRLRSCANSGNRPRGGDSSRGLLEQPLLVAALYEFRTPARRIRP